MIRIRLLWPTVRRRGWGCLKVRATVTEGPADDFDCDPWMYEEADEDLLQSFKDAYAMVIAESVPS